MCAGQQRARLKRRCDISPCILTDASRRLPLDPCCSTDKNLDIRPPAHGFILGVFIAVSHGWTTELLRYLRSQCRVDMADILLDALLKKKECAHAIAPLETLTCLHEYNDGVGSARHSRPGCVD